TQILKEILLTITFEEKHITEFVNYYRDRLAKTKYDIRNIEALERDYKEHYLLSGIHLNVIYMQRSIKN
ncbi:unnamed protein product, partial [Adineta steineri]